MKHPTSLTVAATAAILLSSAHAAPRRPHPNSNTQTPPPGILTSPEAIQDQTFDYIIAGGGLTGLTVASRLSQDPSISVLVIEAGHDDSADPRVNDVRTYGEALSSELDYNLTSTPVYWQNDTGLPLVAGRTLGGSGSINGASWTKGSRSQYDLLPLLTGDEGWGFEAMNALMLEAEHFYEPTSEQVAKGARFDGEVHGYAGPVQVSFPASMFGHLQEDALRASEALWAGLERVEDLAAGVTVGTTIVPNMLDVGEDQNRSSPFTAYAEKQVQERENFVILTGHRVIEINWRKGEEMFAEGVTFQACRDCEKFVAYTKREVLLAAGSLQSPQLLELSGVGDPAVLQAAGVPVKLASPGVGKNMQEQTKNSLFWDPVNTDWDGSGPPNAISWLTTDHLFGNESEKIYQDVLASLPSYSQGLEAAGLVANGSVALTILQAQVDDLWQDNSGAAEIFFVISPANGQVGIDLWNLIVLSRGYVHITSNNSWDHPEIEPSYFGHPFDLEVQIAATRQSREVFQTQPLAKWVTQETFPGNAVAQNASEAEWEGWVKETFTSVWHYIATLSMMKEEFGGVVDSRLKVYGVENVRAIDASVLPIQLSAHLSSSLYGIAEKAAVMIREDQVNADTYRGKGRKVGRG